MNTNVNNENHRLITHDHLRRLAVIYIRQSTEEQVRQNTGSTEYQRSLAIVARSYGWPDSQIQIIDEDLGKSGSTSEGRTGWERLQTIIEARQVGAVFVANISRLSRRVLDFELFRLRAALSSTLLYTDGRLVDPADSNDAIASQITAIVASFENRKRAEVMAQSRIAKAKRGIAVSSLPAGWIKGPDGKFDFDPETKDTIRLIIDTFWQARSIHRTVKMLSKAGIKIPYRTGRNRRICLREPSVARVLRILKNPNYSGTYVYSKSQSQPGGPILAKGYSKRVNVPEERWIKIFNHHPAYMTQEQQEEIKLILKKNQFERRERPGRGAAPLQGLLRCAVCDGKLSVFYPGKRYVYGCSKAPQFAQKPCTRLTSTVFDRAILQEVFKILKSPPIEMLKSALEASRTKKQSRLKWIESQRERYAHEEVMARERADLTRGSLPSVYYDALERLEKVLREKDQFERSIALTPSDSEEESEDQLQELCRIASDVPSLWEHEATTNQEKKEILRSVIDHIVVAATKTTIDATIVWQSGSRTSLTICKRRNSGDLIRELHAQKLTAPEIRQHLAAGKTSTGQVLNFSGGGVYHVLARLGLKPHRRSMSYLSVLQKAIELDREGQSAQSIAEYFNEHGFTKNSQKAWTRYTVKDLLYVNGKKLEPLENVHRRIIGEARARGLDYLQIADELNAKRVRQKGGQRWTAEGVETRWSYLKDLEHKREQALVRKKSA